jgi:hypothetical protein
MLEKNRSKLSGEKSTNLDMYPYGATFSFHIYAMSAAKWAKVPHLFDIFLLSAPIFVMHIKFQFNCAIQKNIHYFELQIVNRNKQ